MNTTPISYGISYHFHFILGLLFFLFQADVNAQTYEIGHTTATFVDADRNNRNIDVEIYYPAAIAGEDVAVDAGVFPIVTFGHGFVMVWSAYANIWEYLVPEGYILIFPRTEGNFFPNHLNFGIDLRFVTDHLYSLDQDNSSIFFEHVQDRAAVMGHSMGGGAGLLDITASDLIKTYVGLAPAETNTSAIAAAASVNIPSLILSGTGDAVTPPNDHHLPIYNALASDCKMFISIDGGAHCYFANSDFNCDFGEGTSGGSIGISRAAQQQITNDYVLPWLQYTLYEDGAALTTIKDALAVDNRVTFMDDCAVVLATENVNFHGYSNGQNTILNWRLEAAEQHGYFEIKHSTDGHFFKMIGQEQKVQQHYQFVHTSPTIGQNYYRLKQVDLNGMVNYSNVLVLEHLAGAEIVYDFYHQQLLLEKIRDGHLKIYSMNGQVVFYQKNVDVVVDLGFLNGGIYVVEVQDGQRILRRKVVVR